MCQSRIQIVIVNVFVSSALAQVNPRGRNKECLKTYVDSNLKGKVVDQPNDTTLRATILEADNPGTVLHPTFTPVGDTLRAWRRISIAEKGTLCCVHGRTAKKK